MEHKLYKKDTNMDVEHSRVKVTYEKPAEELGLIDIDLDLNTAKEDMSQDSGSMNTTANSNYHSNLNKLENLDSSILNDSKRKHRKRHVKKWHQKIQKLKNMLESKF